MGNPPETITIVTTYGCQERRVCPRCHGQGCVPSCQAPAEAEGAPGQASARVLEKIGGPIFHAGDFCGNRG